MAILYKFAADVTPSSYIILLFIAQLGACYYITNDLALIAGTSPNIVWVRLLFF